MRERLTVPPSTLMKKNARFLLLSVAFVLSAHLASAQLVRWSFDEAGTATFADNTGSLGDTYDLNTFTSVSNASTAAANLRVADSLAGSAFSLDLTSTGATAAAQGAHGTLAAPPAAGALSGLTAMTITGWFNPSATPASGVFLLRNSTGSTGGGFNLQFIDAQQLRLLVSDGTASTNYNSAATAYSAGTSNWQFFSVRWTATGGAIWYAGTDSVASTSNGQNTTARSMGSNSFQTILGRSSTAAGNAFHGYLDDIRVYNTALTAEQIEAIRLSNVTALPPSSALQSFRAAQDLATVGSQDLATPAGDGVPNLLKYAFNMIGSDAGQAATLAIPNTTTLAPSGVAGLPAVGMDVNGRLTLSYIRRVGSATPAPGIVYLPEFTSTLESPANWAANPSATESVTPINAAFQRVLVTDSVSTPARRFARVSVTVQ